MVDRRANSSNKAEQIRLVSWDGYGSFQSASSSAHSIRILAFDLNNCAKPLTSGPIARKLC
jgi:hypothetical protein